MTFRSLTHHVALCSVGEAHPAWIGGAAEIGTEKGRNLRLLLIPRPETISPAQFKIVNATRCGRSEFPPSHRFFDYVVQTNMEWLQTDFEEVLRQAGKVDGVIFPELSLATDEELQTAFAIMSENNPSAFLLAGVGQRAQGKTAGENSAKYLISMGDASAMLVTQRKHHRWKLTESQIEQYDLSEALDTGVSLWEHIDIGDRRLHFFANRQSLAFCFLICEDLARQEPVTRLVRAVGPDLVIALLMDGPQLRHRWPAKYASVLSEDPGSSVLSFTSIGFAQRSRTLGSEPHVPSRIVALWSDRTQPPIEIDLAPDAKGILLTLTRENETEYSADGRCRPEAAYFVLDKTKTANIKSIFVPSKHASGKRNA